MSANTVVLGAPRAVLVGDERRGPASTLLAQRTSRTTAPSAASDAPSARARTTLAASSSPWFDHANPRRGRSDHAFEEGALVGEKALVESAQGSPVSVGVEAGGGEEEFWAGADQLWVVLGKGVALG